MALVWSCRKILPLGAPQAIFKELESTISRPPPAKASCKDRNSLSD
jgi:hypothetical protein